MKIVIRLWVVIGCILAAGGVSADILANYDFNSTQANKLEVTDLLAGVDASALSVTGTISQSSGTEPSIIGSGDAGRILLKAADMDTAVFNSERHGLMFTLAPSDSGQYLQITNVVVDLYSVAGGTWRTAAFMDTGSGMTSVTSNSITFTAVGDIAYNENLPAYSGQGGAVTFLIDFANANPAGPNYGTEIDAIRIEGIVTTIPEPTTLGLFAISSAGLIVLRRVYQ